MGQALLNPYNTWVLLNQDLISHSCGNTPLAWRSLFPWLSHAIADAILSDICIYMLRVSEGRKRVRCSHLRASRYICAVRTRTKSSPAPLNLRFTLQVVLITVSSLTVGIFACLKLQVKQYSSPEMTFAAAQHLQKCLLTAVAMLCPILVKIEAQLELWSLLLSRQ